MVLHQRLSRASGVPPAHRYRLASRYRQTHLDPAAAAWATPGADLPVLDTAIGRVGMLLCEDVRFPEAAALLAVRRADLIAVPTQWDGSYGRPLHDAAGLFADQYPVNTMCLLYAVAKSTQGVHGRGQPDHFITSTSAKMILKPLTLEATRRSHEYSEHPHHRAGDPGDRGTGRFHHQTALNPLKTAKSNQLGPGLPKLSPAAR